MSKNVTPELSSGLPFRNVSISGGRLCPRPNSSDNPTDVVQALKSNMTGNEEHIVLQYGTNDGLDCNLNLFRKRYTSLVTTAQSGGAQVHCSGIFHRGDASSQAANHKRNTHIDKLNNIIKSVAANHGCTFIDNCAALSSTASNPRLDVLSAPKQGIKYLHLHQTAKFDFAYRVVEHIECGGAPTQPTQPQQSHPRPNHPKYGRRIKKPSSKPKGGHRRSDSFDESPSRSPHYSQMHHSNGYYRSGYHGDRYNHNRGSYYNDNVGYYGYDDGYYGYDDGYYGYDDGHYGDYYYNEHPRNCQTWRQW